MSSLASHDEDFEVFGPDNTSLGRTEKRAVVHEQGLFHRAVQVLLRNTDGSIGLQKRHEQKDVAPGLWDLSCAEHVQPGESYEAAARRGLLEELGVVDPPPLRQLHAAFLQENEYPALGKIDREFVEVWSLPRYAWVWCPRTGTGSKERSRSTVSKWLSGVGSNAKIWSRN
mmetsp:Transcript_39147/g.84841  ORF Transcript_39147/g.84841 Transcript_39147/m.84841 type:complete len:171 (-) Transcript_39147:97-609(-)